MTTKLFGPLIKLNLSSCFRELLDPLDPLALLDLVDPL